MKDNKKRLPICSLQCWKKCPNLMERLQSTSGLGVHPCWYSSTSFSNTSFQYSLTKSTVWNGIPICLHAYSASSASLKVSKSQKQFFLKLHCPKNKRNIWQNSALASFCVILCLFFGQLSFKKKWFWDILTFNRFYKLRIIWYFHCKSLKQ